MAVKIRHVRFDVKQWCAVQNVYILDVKDTVFYTLQLDYGKTYWIRPLGGASGKETPELAVHEWNDPQVKPLAAVEMIK